MIEVRSLSAKFLFILLTGALPAQAAVDQKLLAERIESNITRVEEFRYIREAAHSLGVRAWLLGGAAAGFGNYVRWDLEREAGAQDFPAERFDYIYQSIYRSSQDLDVVIDGEEEEAKQLKEMLDARFPHKQNQKAAWEVRTLRRSMSNKEPLLNNSDFLERHNDSMSLGMIEITVPIRGRRIIRDLHQWNTPDSQYLRDLAEGRIHFYYSLTHDHTARAVSGSNPPILAAIRFLVKVVQFNLKPDAQSMESVKFIINEEFDVERDVRPHDDSSFNYVRKWFNYAVVKLYQQALDLDLAWNVMNETGLLPKLSEVGDPEVIGSPSWVAVTRPLPAFSRGQGDGLTARELGIKRLYYAPRDFQDYERLSKGFPGVFNVLSEKVKKGFLGGKSTQGAEVYLEKARGPDVRFAILEMNPEARRGTDFEIVKNHLYILNRDAVRVLPESLKPTAAKYFALLQSRQKEFRKTEVGAAQQFRELFTEEKLSPAQEGLIWKMAVAEAEKSDGAELAVLDGWLLSPVAQAHPEFVLEIQDPQVLEFWSKSRLSDPKYSDLMVRLTPYVVEQAIQLNDDKTLHRIARYTLSQPAFLKDPSVLTDFIQKVGKAGDMESFALLAKYVFSRDEATALKSELIAMLQLANEHRAKKIVKQLKKYGAQALMEDPEVREILDKSDLKDRCQEVMNDLE